MEKTEIRDVWVAAPGRQDTAWVVGIMVREKKGNQECLDYSAAMSLVVQFFLAEESRLSQ